VNKIFKARNQPGYFALGGRDGFLTFQPMDLATSQTSTFVHMFQYQTGGVAKFDVSRSGIIVATNLTGKIKVQFDNYFGLQLF